MPAGCRSLPPSAGGGVAGCCPCGSAGNATDSGADGSANDAGAESSDGEQGLPDSDATPPTPDAFVAAYVGPGTGNTSVCGYQSDQAFLLIGAALDPKPATVTSGAFQARSGTLGLSCKVDPSGGGFNIQLSAQIGGLNGGSMTVVGPVTAMGGSGIQGDFASAQNGTFTYSKCSITFAYNNNPVPAMPPIAAGRIWGHIDCPDAMSPVSSVTDGGPVTCDAHADFLFENCQ